MKISSIKKYPDIIWKTNSVLTFGKHKNSKISIVIKSDSGYIHWCLKNIPNFKLTNKAKRLLDKQIVTKKSYQRNYSSNRSYDSYYNFDDRSYAEKRADWPSGDYDDEDIYLGANPYSPLDDGW